MSSEDENLDMFGFDNVDLNAVESVIEDDKKSPETLKQIYSLFRRELGQESAVKLLGEFCKHFG
ncbi:TPA: transcriptional regulator, partial [Vibrio alginolyticus]